MKDLTLANDNILIKVETSPVKRIIEATDHKGKIIKETKWDGNVDKTTIVKVSHNISKNPDYVMMKPGNEILLEGNPLDKKMVYNEIIDEPVEKDEKKKKILYYAIKPFEILAVIK